MDGSGGQGRKWLCPRTRTMEAPEGMALKKIVRKCLFSSYFLGCGSGWCGRWSGVWWEWAWGVVFSASFFIRFPAHECVPDHVFGLLLQKTVTYLEIRFMNHVVSSQESPLHTHYSSDQLTCLMDDKHSNSNSLRPSESRSETVDTLVQMQKQL